jgi:hypothetical protein
MLVLAIISGAVGCGGTSRSATAENAQAQAWVERALKVLASEYQDFHNYTLVSAYTLKNRLSSRFGGDSSVRKRDLDAGAAEVDHRDQRVGGVESVCAV